MWDPAYSSSRPLFRHISSIPSPFLASHLLTIPCGANLKNSWDKPGHQSKMPPLVPTSSSNKSDCSARRSEEQSLRGLVGDDETLDDNGISRIASSILLLSDPFQGPTMSSIPSSSNHTMNKEEDHRSRIVSILQDAIDICINEDVFNTDCFEDICPELCDDSNWS